MSNDAMPAERIDVTRKGVPCAKRQDVENVPGTRQVAGHRADGLLPADRDHLQASRCGSLSCAAS
jgi:hypothetical protein